MRRWLTTDVLKHFVWLEKRRASAVQLPFITAALSCCFRGFCYSCFIKISRVCVSVGRERATSVSVYSNATQTIEGINMLHCFIKE